MNEFGCPNLFQHVKEQSDGERHLFVFDRASDVEEEMDITSRER